MTSTTNSTQIWANQTRTFPITLPTSGGTPSQLNYYEEFNSTFIFSGGGTSPSIPFRITRIGRIVTLFAPTLLYTLSGGANPVSTTPIPARFLPSDIVTFPSIITAIIISNNSVEAAGQLSINTTTGIMQISTASAGPLSAGPGGFEGLCISWNI